MPPFFVIDFCLAFFLTVLNDGLDFGTRKLDDSDSMGPGEFATSEMASAFKHN